MPDLAVSSNNQRSIAEDTEDPQRRIIVRGLRKTFAGNTVFDDFNASIAMGKVTSIFGPNGCGKSTLLHMAAGLVDLDAGSIDFEPGKRRPQTGYVFQNYREALFPWRSAYENIAYPLIVAGWSKSEKRQLIDTMVDLFGVGFDLHRYPYELSGGQQQITAVMRALATNPDVLFLDEPFSALDFEMTLSLRDTLQQVQLATGVTMVLVSHDLEEAVYLSDEIMLLSKPPTSVVRVITFDAERPRNEATLSSPEFVRVKAEALAVFQREVRR